MRAQTIQETQSPEGLYRKVILTLIGLTILTMLATHVNFGSTSVNIVIALTIATVKATLVALFFMHLRHGNLIPAVIFFASLVFLGLLLAFCFLDTSTRVAIPAPAAVRTTTPFVDR